MMRRPAKLLSFASFACLTATSALTQAPLEFFESGSSYDLFGEHVRVLDDLDGDGFRELGVGAYGKAPGRLYAFSGVDGSLLYSIKGKNNDSNSFAYCFEALHHDLDSDGVADYVVGAMKHDGLRGRVAIVSGADGSELSEVLGDGPDGWFGYSVSHLGDVDGDGVPEFVAGAANADIAGPDFGRVRVVNPSTGVTWLAIDGFEQNSRFGANVDGLGDVNGDGYADFVVGAGKERVGTKNSAGRVRVFSGLDGTLVHVINGTQAGGNLGERVRAAGDVDQDGIVDIIAGARGFDVGSSDDAGLVRVYSGATGNQIHQFTGSQPNGLLGWGVGPVGDVDGDGGDDFAFAGRIPGVLDYVVVVQGHSGKVLRTIEGPNSFGGDIDGVPDITGDGFDELLIGAQQYIPFEFGATYLYQGHPGDVLGTVFCSPANDNSTGRPGEIFAAGSAKIAAHDTWLLAQHLPRMRTTLLLASELSGFTPFAGGSQGNLCLAGSILRLGAGTTTARGTQTWQVPVANLPGYGPIQPGDTWRFQAWYRDANPGSTSNFSEACAILFQ